jgi:photosystem II stability/assembly factor-like uncharacterized protein
MEERAMSELLIGTSGGLFRLADGEVQREEGPPSAVYLALGADGAFALTRDGALWREDAGGWRLVSERAVRDEIWSFAADPRLPGRLYLGVSPALLYRSDDGGATWSACDSIRRIPGYETWTFPPPPHIPHVRSIAPDPELPGGLYIGVEEGGVYRSRDGGETWESLNEGLYWDVHTVTPAEGDRLYATTGGGFYRSDDGGGHWRHLTAGIDRGYTVPFIAPSQQPGRLYVAAAAGPPPTWGRGADAAIYRSDDGGERWTRLDQGLPPRLDTMVMALAGGGDGDLYAASGAAVFSSADGGETWRSAAQELPSVRALAVLS